MLKRTSDPFGWSVMSIFLTKPRVTMSLLRSGSTIVDRACFTSLSLGLL